MRFVLGDDLVFCIDVSSIGRSSDPDGLKIFGVCAWEKQTMGWLLNLFCGVLAYYSNIT